MPLQILMAGLPGRMAQEVVLAALEEAPGDFNFAPSALAATTEAEPYTVGPLSFRLVGPADRRKIATKGLLAIDFTQPDAALPNLEWYIAHDIPVVIGTTGFDRAAAEKIIRKGSVPVVMAPNMAVPIVLIQAALAHLAENYPEAMSGYKIAIRESHQANKKDTSGTARALAKDFATLGLPAGVEMIEMVRDPDRQRQELHVPDEFLGGHAYHFYNVVSPEGSVHLGLSHCIHGRRVYASGALFAARFLARRAAEQVGPLIFGMDDVLRGG